MGLSGPKSRNKISRDPNNNAWSRSTDRFGHRILAAQGWTPGSYLGAKDASHSDHYTAANASHIRVLLRDDNLGLGAKTGDVKAETFGLSALQGLLGRLNGKSEGELKKEEKAQRDIQLALYQGQRWGSMNFISGGFLIGDTITEKRIKTQDVTPSKRSQAATGGANLDGGAIKSAKRKRSEVEEQDTSDAAHRKKEKKRKRKHDGSRSEQNTSEAPSTMAKARETLAVAHTSTARTADDADEEAQADETSALEADRKAQRKIRKEERRARKEAKRLMKEKRLQKEMLAERSDPALKPVTGPKSSPTVNFTAGRHAVRQRYIHQKKMASLDPQALREIFMIKTPA